MTKNKNTKSMTKAINVTKSGKKKVADLSKGKRSASRKAETGFSRSHGLLIIAVVGILFGLLLFNLIVHFGIQEQTTLPLLTSSLSTKGQGVVKSFATFTAHPQSAFENVSFSYPTTSEVGTFLTSDSAQTVYVFDETPGFSKDGGLDYEVALSRTDATVDAEIAKEAASVLAATKKEATQTKVTIAGVSGTEIANSSNGSKVIIFKDKSDRVMTLYFSKDAIADGTAAALVASLKTEAVK